MRGSAPVSASMILLSSVEKMYDSSWKLQSKPAVPFSDREGMAVLLRVESDPSRRQFGVDPG